MASTLSSKPVKGVALLKDLKEALRGSNADYTQGSMSRAILLLSVRCSLRSSTPLPI